MEISSRVRRIALALSALLPLAGRGAEPRPGEAPPAAAARGAVERPADTTRARPAPAVRRPEVPAREGPRAPEPLRPVSGGEPDEPVEVVRTGRCGG